MVNIMHPRSPAKLYYWPECDNICFIFFFFPIAIWLSHSQLCAIIKGAVGIYPSTFTNVHFKEEE